MARVCPVPFGVLTARVLVLQLHSYWCRKKYSYLKQKLHIELSFLYLFSLPLCLRSGIEVFFSRSAALLTVRE